jgi:hypothetical protein
LPSAQGRQAPPQSTSVSRPFLAVSPQLAVWQIPSVQIPSAQLDATEPQL